MHAFLVYKHTGKTRATEKRKRTCLIEAIAEPNAPRCCADSRRGTGGLSDRDGVRAGRQRARYCGDRKDLCCQGPPAVEPSDRPRGFDRDGAQRWCVNGRNAPNVWRDRFWPGPLTLVLPKQPHVPDRLTAGLDTVGVRMPNNAIALALIQEAGVPVAAPSANRLQVNCRRPPRSMSAEALGDRVAMILDGGADHGRHRITVLSLAGAAAILLRPGMVSKEEIEEVIGPVQAVGQRSWPSASFAGHASPPLQPAHSTDFDRTRPASFNRPRHPG